jgi:hypothetical protein
MIVLGVDVGAGTGVGVGADVGAGVGGTVAAGGCVGSAGAPADRSGAGLSADGVAGAVGCGGVTAVGAGVGAAAGTTRTAGVSAGGFGLGVSDATTGAGLSSAGLCGASRSTAGAGRTPASVRDVVKDPVDGVSTMAPISAPSAVPMITSRSCRSALTVHRRWHTDLEALRAPQSRAQPASMSRSSLYNTLPMSQWWP